MCVESLCACAAPLPDRWLQGEAARPDGHDTAVSDIFFLASHLRLLEVAVTPTVTSEGDLGLSLHAHGVATANGSLHRCDILIDFLAISC